MHLFAMLWHLGNAQMPPAAAYEVLNSSRWIHGSTLFMTYSDLFHWHFATAMMQCFQLLENCPGDNRVLKNCLGNNVPTVAHLLQRLMTCAYSHDLLQLTVTLSCKLLIYEIHCPTQAFLHKQKWKWTVGFMIRAHGPYIVLQLLVFDPSWWCLLTHGRILSLW